MHSHQMHEPSHHSNDSCITLGKQMNKSMLARRGDIILSCPTNDTCNVCSAVCNGCAPLMSMC